MGKKLILCFDGTSNEFGKNNTNIVKIYRALEKESGVQVVFYDPGIGTIGPSTGAEILRRAHVVLGMITGFGISENIKDGYKFLMNNFETGDEVFIYGFSRGAFTARSLAGMLSKVGLLDKGLENMIPYAYKIYSDDRNHGFTEEFKKTYGQDCQIKLVGVFDTVGALIGPKICLVTGIFVTAVLGYLGFPVLNTYLNLNFLGQGFLPYFGAVLAVLIFRGHIGRFIERTVLGSHHFHDTALSHKVDVGLHALAIDEKRWLFSPVRWNLTNKAPNQKIEQVWFSGVHIDVGGFDPKLSQTSDNALLWMISHSEKAGLKFDLKDQIKPSVKLLLGKNSKFWKIAVPIARKIHEADRIHSSVVARYEKNDAYDIDGTVSYEEKFCAKPPPYQTIAIKFGKLFAKLMS